MRQGYNVAMVVLDNKTHEFEVIEETRRPVA